MLHLNYCFYKICIFDQILLFELFSYLHILCLVVLYNSKYNIFFTKILLKYYSLFFDCIIIYYEKKIALV